MALVAWRVNLQRHDELQGLDELGPPEFNAELNYFLCCGCSAPLEIHDGLDLNALINSLLQLLKRLAETTVLSPWCVHSEVDSEVA